MPHVLLVFDGTPTPDQVARETRRILAEHSKRERHARRADAARGREAVRRVLVARVLNTLTLNALARRGRAEVQS